MKSNTFRPAVWHNQWRSHGGGGGYGGRVPPLKAKNREKEGKNQEKEGKKRTNREEKVKIGKVLSLCPSWQIGLATLLDKIYTTKIEIPYGSQIWSEESWPNCNTWIKGHSGVIPGNQWLICLELSWLPNSIGRSPVHSIMQYFGHFAYTCSTATICITTDIMSFWRQRCSIVITKRALIRCGFKLYS